MILPFSGNKYNFKPGLFLSLFFICVIGLLTALGIWQLDRAEEKKAQAIKINERLSSELIELKNNKPIDNVKVLLQDNLDYRHIKLTGRFATKNQYFVDNKKHNARTGYHLISPFIIDKTRQVILVNRGWVDSGGKRNILPPIKTDDGMVSIEGRLSLPVKARFRPGISQPAENLGGIWLYNDLEFFSQLSGTRLVPYILLLDKQNPHGFIRQWPEFKANTEMHVGYAIQWFAFALFSLLAYLSIATKRQT
jgi:surfeit locus 1 family protein